MELVGNSRGIKDAKTKIRHAIESPRRRINKRVRFGEHRSRHCSLSNPTEMRKGKDKESPKSKNPKWK